MDRIIVFIFGSIIGSFLNVCIDRLPKGESVISPPSHCDHCKKNIKWYDNVPVLSYLALRGKCRYCKARISFRCLLVEVLTAALLVLLYIAFGPILKFFAYSLLACGLIIATFVDFERSEIPDQVSLGGIAAGILLSWIFPGIFDQSSRWAGLLGSFVGVLAGGFSIYSMGFIGEIIFKKEAMGGGDVKLMAMIGAFLGWKLTLLAFFIAPVFGALVGIVIKIRDGREVIPYGPYLSLAALISIFYGNDILRLFLYGIY